MRFVNKLLIFLNTNLGKQLKMYSFFYAVVWIVHLIIISVITYFHLILNHNIGTIADWIVDRGWTVIIFTKILIFYFAITFMKLRTRKYSLIRGMLQNAIAWPRHECSVIILFLLLATISIGNIQFNSAIIIDIFRVLVSATGTLIFFGIDIFLILILDVYNPIREEIELRKKLFVFPLFFYLYTRMTFVYELNISLKLYAFMFILIYLAYWRRRNWTLPIVLLVSFYIPIFTFLGLDPIWGHNFSIFIPTRAISTLNQFIIIAFAYLYLEWRKNNHPEYISRD